MRTATQRWNANAGGPAASYRTASTRRLTGAPVQNYSGFLQSALLLSSLSAAAIVVVRRGYLFVLLIGAA